jgi:integrase
MRSTRLPRACAVSGHDLQAYQAGDDFRGRAQRTRVDYVKQIKIIEAEYGDFPLSALADRRTRGIFMAWRDRLALRSRRQADYAWQVLARVLSWAQDRGLVAANPCAHGGRLYRASRTEKVWTADDEANFLAKAPSHLHLALMLAIWTGQRQGDRLRLAWSNYDGKTIRLQQSKAGARVVIPVGAPLGEILDATSKRSPLVLANTFGARRLFRDRDQLPSPGTACATLGRYWMPTRNGQSDGMADGGS